MKKTLLSVLTLLCTAMVMVGGGTACNSNANNSSSSSEQVQNLVIKGRPTGDIATITDTVNTVDMAMVTTNILITKTQVQAATRKNNLTKNCRNSDFFIPNSYFL